MRSISATLLAAQQSASPVPHVEVKVTNCIAGIVRLEWKRIYSGTETDYIYSATMPGDGSLIRIRLTQPADGGKLYFQRVAAPGVDSDFSDWQYTGYYGLLAAGCCSLNSTVSILWIDADRKLMLLQSEDCGASWETPEIIDYAISTAVYGLAAAYSPAGDLAVFFADQSELYVKKYTGNQWQELTEWDKTTGDLSGIACVYDGDWNILLTGRDTQGSYKLWSLVYGNNGELPAGTWSTLNEMASAPPDGDFEFLNPCLDKPDVFRCFYTEKFNGVSAYTRPFWSHSIPSASFHSVLWREPVPFHSTGGYSMGLTHFNDRMWLSCSCGVWMALLVPQSMDLSADVIALKEELGKTTGKLTVTLRNDDGRYNSPAEGRLAVINNGCQVELHSGYRTAAGNETGSGRSFVLEAFEHFTGGGKSGFVLYAFDGWEALRNWQSYYQLRWNAGSSVTSVRQILEFVLARVGIRLEVISQSGTINDFYPDFNINPGSSGDAVICQLLTFVPDELFIEGSTAYLINPLTSDSPVYIYGNNHCIKEGRYRKNAMRKNYIRVEGYDDNSG